MIPVNRTRPDRCPGVLRPWPADDGMLVRLRLPGGRVTVPSLNALIEVAERFGDGRIHVTSRANLQLRALPADGDGLPGDVLTAIEATGLLPSREHDLARNVMVSPQTGLAGGRADLRAVVAYLDAAVCASPELGGLPGRFLFVLDDGRGDLLDRPCDLGLVALSHETAQLRIGEAWGPVVGVAEAPRHLVALAMDFLAARGSGPDAAWHVHELAAPLRVPQPPAVDLPAAQPPLAFGPVPGGFHQAVPPEGLDRAAVDLLGVAAPDQVVVTPWRGVLIPEETP